MRLDRRGFFSLLATAPLVALVSFQPPKTWKYLKFTGWKEMMDTACITQQLVGYRSDSKWYYVTCALRPDELNNQACRNALQENAIDSINTFLDCSCRPGYICSSHKNL